MNITCSTFLDEATIFMMTQYSMPAMISEFKPGMPMFSRLVLSPTANPTTQHTSATGFQFSTFDGSVPVSREASSALRLRRSTK